MSPGFLPDIASTTADAICSLQFKAAFSGDLSFNI
jgi:hypothetical protein